jgi:hypothetical protein
MIAVWSFWSKPFQAVRRSAWLTERHHLMGWVLSLETARCHYPRTALFTDDDGARLLVDTIGLEFDSVSTGLNALAHHDPQWWALGKLWTYRAQDAPFVHIDNDVFLWNRLPEWVETAPVLAQNPEPFLGESAYKPELIDYFIRTAGSGWLPEEWEWYRQQVGIPRGDCCGIFGGNATDFIRHYANQALRLVEDPRNRRGWAMFGDKSDHMILLEQYLLAACVEFHRNQDSPFRDLRIKYLFASIEEAHHAGNAVRLGYTHLIANAKRNEAVATRLEQRVARDYAEHYERINRVFRAGSTPTTSPLVLNREAT